MSTESTNDRPDTHPTDAAPAAQQGEEESGNILLVPTLQHEVIPINLDDIVSGQEDPSLVIELFIQERVELKLWIRFIETCWKVDKFNLVFELIEKASGLTHLSEKDKTCLLGLKANYLIGLARKAPKLILSQPRSGSTLMHSTNPNHPESKNTNPQAPPMTKEEYWTAAEISIARAERMRDPDPSIRDIKATLAMARGRLEEASKLYEAILSNEPTHVYALMGRARILFARRSFRLALKTYQQVLTLSPNLVPDPRIGIGLCCYLLGDRKRARAAWKRSLAVHPDSPNNSATLLLGLAHLNSSKDPTYPGGEEARTEEYSKGIDLIQQAFKRDNTSAAAAGPLANYFLLSGRNGAIKLAERMIQFADSRILVSEGYLHLARSLHSINDRSALSVYQQSSELYPEQLLALLAEAQFMIEANSFPAAVNVYENILRRNPRCVEALVAIASIHAHLAFIDSSVQDSMLERKKAKEAFENVLRLFASGKENEGIKDHVVNKYIAKSERVRELARDENMFIEIARIWDDDLQGGERCLRAYKEALRIIQDRQEDEEEEAHSNKDSELIAKVSNNVGVLEFHRQDPIAAQASIETSLVKIGETISKKGGKISEEDDAVLSVCTYNRGVVLEALGDDEAASDCYKQVLTQHPEYIEAKARLALIALRSSSHGSSSERQRYFDTANSYLREMLTANSSALEVRALQTYYLHQSGQFKYLRDFCRTTLSIDVNDAYALCARGMVSFYEARENRDPSSAGAKMRQQTFVRAAQYFEKALQEHKNCAVAAQGLAVLVAEGSLGTGLPRAEGESSSSSQAMSRNTRDALTILNRVKESINDASVYVNIGHCHFNRDEFERAIESYETASKRYNDDKDVTILQYLARAWYQKGIKDSSFSDIHVGLEKARLALALQPRDLSIKYNIALIQQKAVEVLFDLPPQRRTVEELELALKDAQESQALFEELTNDPTDPPPYQKDLPRHRHRYGISILNRAAAVQDAQDTYERTEQAAIDRARQAREEERRKREEMERERLEALREQAERLAEQRRVMQEQAAQWTLSATFADSEDDGGPDDQATKGERKKKREKGTAGGGGKKRSKKEKRAATDESGASSSDDEEDKPKKKKSKSKGKKQRAARADSSGAPDMELDEDGEEAVTGGNRRRGRASKIIKSNEFIESSDEDED